MALKTVEHVKIPDNYELLRNYCYGYYDVSGIDLVKNTIQTFDDHFKQNAAPIPEQYFVLLKNPIYRMNFLMEMFCALAYFRVGKFFFDAAYLVKENDVRQGDVLRHQVEGKEHHFLCIIGTSFNRSEAILYDEQTNKLVSKVILRDEYEILKPMKL